VDIHTLQTLQICGTITQTFNMTFILSKFFHGGVHIGKSYLHLIHVSVISNSGLGHENSNVRVMQLDARDLKLMRLNSNFVLMQ